MDDALFSRLIAWISDWSGVAPDAVRPVRVRTAVEACQKRHVDFEALLAGGTPQDPEIRELFAHAIAVRETYFFRDPSHFEFVSSVARDRLGDPSRPIRVWSAGCATGEEAYSLAACLLDSVGDTRAVEVLGTDLVAEHVRIAQRGLYGRWSLRVPIIHGGIENTGPDLWEISKRVREVVRFRQANLMEEAPEGPFDLIFCRNVVAYLSERARDRIAERLSSALSPNGLLLMGILDADRSPPGTKRYDGTIHNVFTPGKPTEPPKREVSVAPPKRPPPTKVHEPRTFSSKGMAPAPKDSPELHRRLHHDALAFIENGDHGRALEILRQLAHTAPNYVPGLFERALLHRRSGEEREATELMREVLKKTEAAEKNLEFEGHLNADYYREAAAAFLRKRTTR